MYFYLYVLVQCSLYGIFFSSCSMHWASPWSIYLKNFALVRLQHRSLMWLCLWSWYVIEISFAFYFYHSVPIRKGNGCGINLVAIEDSSSAHCSYVVDNLTANWKYLYAQDITSKIMLLSELQSKSICILSANGPLSAITLRLSSESGGLDNAVYQVRLSVLSVQHWLLLFTHSAINELVVLYQFDAG